MSNDKRTNAHNQPKLWLDIDVIFPPPILDEMWYIESNSDYRDEK